MKRALPKLIAAIAVASIVAMALYQSGRMAVVESEHVVSPGQSMASPSETVSRDAMSFSGEKPAEPLGEPVEPSEEHVPAGELMTVELIFEPAVVFSGAKFTEEDRAYEPVVRNLGIARVKYDPNLGHAARELAYQHSLAYGLVPHSVVEFLLRAAGAVDRTVTQGYTSTSGDGMKAVEDRLKRMLSGRRGSGPLRVGVGEAFIPGGKPSRYIAVLVSERQLEVNTTPRTISMGQTWTLSGILPPGYVDPSALVMRVDGKLEPVEVVSDGRRFSVRVVSGFQEGTLYVSVGASGPFGSKPLVQLPVIVGNEVPRVASIRRPPDESEIQTPAQAERLALALLNADRRRFGLHALERDESLDDISRTHSVDMAENGFFGHVSPNSGSPGDRLSAAGFRASVHAENVAHGDSIHGAQSGLMKSLGHRRNILNRNVTHVGIGVTGKSDGSRIHWTLTQLFALPVAKLDISQATKDLLHRINSARLDAGFSQLRRDAALDQIALRAARSAAAGGSEGLPQQVLDRARTKKLIPRGAYVSVQSTTDMNDIQISSELNKGSLERLGLGIVQLSDHPSGLIGVVMVFAGGRR